MRWLGYVAGMGEKDIAYWVLVRRPEETCIEDVGIHGRIMLTEILKKQGGNV
jgi:hypothetical protein